MLCTYAVQCHLLAALTPLVPSSVQIRLSPATCLQFLCMVPPCRASFPERSPLKNELRCSMNCIWISLLVIVLFHLFTQATATRTPFSSTSRVSRGCAVRTSTATSRSCGSWARPVCFSFPLVLCNFLGRPLTCVKVTVSAHEAPRKTAQKSSEHTLEA